MWQCGKVGILTQLSSGYKHYTLSCMLLWLEVVQKISFRAFSSLTSCHSQAQKELLDAELDLYQKTQAGEDTALLKIKYTQLQIEVQDLI